MNIDVIDLRSDTTSVTSLFRGMVKTATNQNGDRSSVLNEVSEDNVGLYSYFYCCM